MPILPKITYHKNPIANNENSKFKQEKPEF